MHKKLSLITIILIICAFTISAITNGIRSSMGVFLDPMVMDRSYTVEIFSWALAVQNLLWGICAPIAGGLADRYGNTKVISFGLLVYTAGLVGMNMFTSSMAFSLSAGLLVGIGLSAASFSLVMTAVAGRVPDTHRTWVIGLILSAGSLGQFIFAPFCLTLINRIGYSKTLLVLAGLVAALVFFLAPFRPAKAVTESKAATDKPTNSKTSESSINPLQAISIAMRHSDYRLLVMGFFVCGFQLAFITVHFPKYIIDSNLSASTGAMSIALIGLFNIFGSYISGVLASSRNKSMMLSINYLARGITFAVFLILPISTTTVVLFSITLGLLWLSTIPPTSGLIATMFGMRFLSTLYGLAFLSHQIGSFLGVWLAGYMKTQYGSYDLVWWLGVALSLGAAGLHFWVADAPSGLQEQLESSAAKA